MADDLERRGVRAGVVPFGKLSLKAGESGLLKGPISEAPAATFSPTVGTVSPVSLRDVVAGLRDGKIPHERAHFRTLLLSNPNYFGNLEESAFESVTTIKGDTRYEELQCVGFEPQLELLEAVVLVKQDFGYLGGICTTGSVEYVRFYTSTDDGATWDDQGETSFAAHDIPGDKPLEYAVSLHVDPDQTWCSEENLVKVRAILSWNNPPPPNTPDFPPVWGNVAEADIQVDPWTSFTLADLLTASKLELPAHLGELVDVKQKFPGLPPKKVDPVELHALYAKADVPAHRYLLETVEQQFTLQGMVEQTVAAGQSTLEAKLAVEPLFQSIDVDIAKLLGSLLDTFGDTKYEALDCVGLNPVNGTLEAALTVKLSSGYSGGLCTAGSYEYVAFWIDWGSGWEYAGTSSVNVHDIKSIPPGGLHYGVVLPISLTEHRRPCEAGAQVARVRAILSWQSKPSGLDPEFEPTWGNRVDTLIEIASGPDLSTGSHLPNIETVGHVDVTYIDPSSGLATGPMTNGRHVLDSPFGGNILLTGHIAYPPNTYGGGATPLQYRVWVTEDGATWQTLTTPFGITYHTLNGGIWSAGISLTQTADPAGWYDYLEDITGSNQRYVAENVLHLWRTSNLMNGLARIIVEARDPANPGLGHWWSGMVTVQLDNLPPTSALAITSGGGACADVVKGDPIEGTYAVSDQGDHFGAFHLYVEPSPQATAGTLTVDPAPSGPPLASGAAAPGISRSYTGLSGGVPTIGEAGTWKLETQNMPRCGYVIRLDAWDRTNRNSSGPGWHAVPQTVGFCLREKGPNK